MTRNDIKTALANILADVTGQAFAELVGCQVGLFEDLTGVHVELTQHGAPLPTGRFEQPAVVHDQALGVRGRVVRKGPHHLDLQLLGLGLHAVADRRAGRRIQIRSAPVAEHAPQHHRCRHRRPDRQPGCHQGPTLAGHDASSRRNAVTASM